MTRGGDDERRIDQAIALARQLVEEAARLEARQPRRERRHRARMRALVRDAAAADFTVRLTDEVPRIPVPATAARRFSKLVDQRGPWRLRLARPHDATTSVLGSPRCCRAS